MCRCMDISLSNRTPGSRTTSVHWITGEQTVMARQSSDCYVSRTRWTPSWWAKLQSGYLMLSLTIDRVVNTCAQSVKYERNHVSDCPVTENRDSRINSSEVWSTVSNAELRSKSTRPVISPRSIAQTMSLWSTSTADSVELNWRYTRIAFRKRPFRAAWLVRGLINK